MPETSQVACASLPPAQDGSSGLLFAGQISVTAAKKRPWPPRRLIATTPDSKIAASYSHESTKQNLTATKTTRSLHSIFATSCGPKCYDRSRNRTKSEEVHCNSLA